MSKGVFALALTHTCGCHGDVNVSSMLQKISVRMKHLRSVIHGPHRGYRCAPFF